MDRSVLTDWERLIAAGSECERAKEYGKAAEHYEAAAKLAPAVERTYGPLHEDTTKLVLKLGHALGLQHKHAEADQLYERWLQAAEAAGGDDLRVIRVITDMARNFRSAGSTARAQSMYSRALTLSESLPGDAPQEVLLELGTLYGAQGRYEEAEKLLRRCWSKAYPSDTQVAEALADVLRRTGREKEAGEIEEHARRHEWYMDV